MRTAEKPPCHEVQNSIDSIHFMDAIDSMAPGHLMIQHGAIPHRGTVHDAGEEDRILEESQLALSTCALESQTHQHRTNKNKLTDV